MENYIFLKHKIHVNIEEDYVETLAFNRTWLLKYLSDCGRDFDGFLKEYDSEDVDQMLGTALLDEAVAFGFCPNLEQSFRLLDENASWRYEAFAEVLSQSLQDAKADIHDGEEASKYIDAIIGM